MTVNDNRSDTPSGALIRQAMEQARDLIKTEVDLAKGDVRQEVKGVARSAIAFAVGAAVGLLAVAVLLVSFGIATFPHVLPTFIVGMVLVLMAGVAVGLGVAMLPKKPLAKTRDRLEAGVQTLKERIA